MANPDHVELVRQGAEATRKWWNEKSPGARLDLHGVDLSGADLHEPNLREANLSGAFLVKTNLRRAFLAEANLSHAQLSEADLRQANLHRADLSWAILEQADLRWAYLGGASLYKASLYKVQGAYRAHGLETVRFTPSDTTDAVSDTTDTQNFEACNRPWPERWLDWERLRVVGRLPLFGASYTVLILIPIIFYGLALYNDKIELVCTWAEHVTTLPDHPHAPAHAARPRAPTPPPDSQPVLPAPAVDPPIGGGLNPVHVF
jgi:Pentapeptide repeats (8 copies)